MTILDALAIRCQKKHTVIKICFNIDTDVTAHEVLLGLRYTF